MPGLYANVNVGNTVGLYQQNTGTSQVLTGAQTLLSLLSNAGTVGFSLTNANTQVQADVDASGVTAGTYGSSTLIPVVTVGNDGRVTTVSTVAVSGGGGSTYSNANVAAYLPVQSGNVNANSYFGRGNQLTGLTGAAAGVYGSDVIVPTIVVDASGRITQITTNAVSGGGSYGNANVALYLSSNLVSTISTTGNIKTVANVVSPNYLFPNGVNILSTVTSGTTYSNTNVAAYLTTATITTTGNVTAANLTTAGNLTAAYVKGDGSLLTNLPTQAGTYSNANVASYMPVFGGNILAGNVDIPYTSGTRNRGPLAVGGTLNHYDSGVVASFQGNEATYLYTSLQNTNTGNTAYGSYAVNDATHTYYGELGINSGTYDYAAAGYPNNAFSLPYATFLQSTGANLAVGTYTNHGISFLVNGQTNTADAMTIANSGNVTVTGNLTVGTLATVGNVKSTSGYFWSNGTAYSTGSGTAFTGNLAGSILFDSVNERILMQANNLSAISYPTGSLLNVNFFAPNALSFYGNGVVSPATGSGVATYAASANVTIGTRNGTNWSPTGQYNLSQMYPDPSATSMSNADRIRGIANTLELYPSGKNWGTFYTPSAANATIAANLATVVAMNGLLSTVGTGYVSHAIAVASVNQLNPVGGSANIFMQTGTYASVGWNSATTVPATRTASNIGYARLFGGVINGGSQQANLTISNAIGLHITNSWAPGGVSGADTITNRYAVLNEDAGTKIQTNGNLVVTGNTQIQALQETVSALGSTGGAITINATNGTIQTLTLTSSISSLAFTGLPPGGTVTLIITQGGSGSYTLTTTGIKYAGASSTLSTAVGAIDMLNILYDGTNYYGSLVKGYA